MCCSVCSDSFGGSVVGNIWSAEVPIIRNLNAWRYAFPSPERFVRWFSESDCSALDAGGFVLACYVVPRRAVRCATEQALFKVARAKRRRVYALPGVRARVLARLPL